MSHWLDDDYVEPVAPNPRLMRNAYATHTDYSEFLGLIELNPLLVPSNVDGILERKGKFLILEWKRENEEVSKGQQYMLQALASKPDFTVIILIGNTDTETIINRFFLDSKAGCILMGHGFEEFKKYYIDWYKKADGY